MNLFNLFAKISLDTKDYEQKLKGAEKEASSFSSKTSTKFDQMKKVITGTIAVISAVSTAITALAIKSISFGDDIDKTSQKLGLSTEAYQEWSLAAQMAGADVSTLQTGIRQLTQFYQDLEDGQGDALLALQQLGIGYDDFMAMNNDERLKTVVEAMQGLEDGTDKTRLAQELFGQRAYQELMPLLNQEKGSIDDLFQSYKDLGLIVSDDVIKSSADLSDEIDLLKTKFQVLFLNLSSDLFPIIEKVITWISDHAIETLAILVGSITAIVTIVNILNAAMMANPVGLIVEAIALVVAGLVTLGIVIAENWDAIKGFFNQVGDFFKRIWEKIVGFFTDLAPWLEDKVLKPIANFFIGLLNGIIIGLESFINFFIKAINGITGGISKIWTWTGLGEIPEIRPLKISRVEYLADGGMFDGIGTMYAVAGEGGAEIVAQGSRGTGVANIDQISEAQYNAMRDYGIKETIQNAVSGIVNGIVGGLSIGTNDKNNVNVVVKIGERDITDIVNKSIYATGRRSLYKTTEWK